MHLVARVLGLAELALDQHRAPATVHFFGMTVGQVEGEDEDLLQHLDHVIVGVIVVIQKDYLIQRDQLIPLQNRRIGSGGRLRHARVTTSIRHPPCYNQQVTFVRQEQGKFMPKLKTHKGASKRFKKTGTGKVVRNHAFGRHILTSKPHKRKKKLHQSVVADKADQKVLQRMIPY